MDWSPSISEGGTAAPEPPSEMEGVVSTTRAQAKQASPVTAQTQQEHEPAVATRVNLKQVVTPVKIETRQAPLEYKPGVAPSAEPDYGVFELEWLRRALECLRLTWPWLRQIFLK